MCWSNYIATPIVLKKPLRVYKVGASTVLGNFISLYQGTPYNKNEVMPTVEIHPEFTRRYLFVPGDKLRMGDTFRMWDTFYIYEGYHSYLTEEMAKCRSNGYDDIGVFEIPEGATIYVDYQYKEVVSTNIKYLGLLKLQTFVWQIIF